MYQESISNKVSIDLPITDIGAWVFDGPLDADGITVTGSSCQGFITNGAQAGSRYNGGVLKNKRHGYGETESADGNKYAGNYFNGERHGHGSFKAYRNCSSNSFGTPIITYEGEWKWGKKCGHGKQIQFSTGLGRKMEYTGSWKNGEKCGKGVFITFENQTMSPNKNRLVEIFEGEWEEGVRVRGVLTDIKRDGQGNTYHDNKDCDENLNEVASDDFVRQFVSYDIFEEEMKASDGLLL